MLHSYIMSNYNSPLSLFALLSSDLENKSQVGFETLELAGERIFLNTY